MSLVTCAACDSKQRHKTAKENEEDKLIERLAQEAKEAREVMNKYEDLPRESFYPAIGMTMQRVTELCGRSPDHTSSMTTATGTVSTWSYRRKSEPGHVSSWSAVITRCNGQVYGFNETGVLTVIMD